MNEQATYVVFHTVEGNEDLLKATCRKLYPHLRLNFSSRGFVSFKSKKRLSANQLLQIHPYFYLRKGRFVEKFANLKELKNFHQTHFRELKLISWQIDPLSETSPSLAPGTWYLTWTKLSKGGKKPYWLTISQASQWSTLHSRENPMLTPDKEAPSRAYYKLAEIFHRLEINYPEGTQVLDLGSSPGGSTLFLEKQNFSVTAVDPGKMAQVVKEKDNVRFIQVPIQDVRAKDLAEKTKVLAADMNLPPKVIMQQCLKIARQLPEIEVLFLTLKMPSTRLVKTLQRYLKWCKSAGFPYSKALQLYYHRREIVIVASKKNLFRKELGF